MDGWETCVCACVSVVVGARYWMRGFVNFLLRVRVTVEGVLTSCVPRVEWRLRCHWPEEGEESVGHRRDFSSHPFSHAAAMRCISRGRDIINDPVLSHPHHGLLPTHSVQALHQLFPWGHRTAELWKIYIILAVATLVLNGKNWIVTGRVCFGRYDLTSPFPQLNSITCQRCFNLIKRLDRRKNIYFWLPWG